jgi:hypothetical protein
LPRVITIQQQTSAINLFALCAKKKRGYVLADDYRPCMPTGLLNAKTYRVAVGAGLSLSSCKPLSPHRCCQHRLKSSCRYHPSHIMESRAEREPWIWILEIILGEIDRQQYQSPFKFEQRQDGDT